MLAVGGFAIAGLLFLAYALTFKDAFKSAKLHVMSDYAYAYMTMAFGFFGWALAAATNQVTVLKVSLIFGNAMFLLATFFLLQVFLPQKNRATYNVLISIALLGLFAYRALFSPISPYLQDGILYFNSSQLVSLFLILVVALVWLPSNARLAILIATATNTQKKVGLYRILYIIATVSTVIFLSAQRAITVVASFGMLIVVFAVLIYLNVLIKNNQDKNHATK